jgi:hypothetical protein
MSNQGHLICLACGDELPEPLRWTGSLRCHDCRALSAPIKIEYARWERAHKQWLAAVAAWDSSETPTAA